MLYRIVLFGLCAIEVCGSTLAHDGRFGYLRVLALALLPRGSLVLRRMCGGSGRDGMWHVSSAATRCQRRQWYCNPARFCGTLLRLVGVCSLGEAMRVVKEGRHGE